jgi:hypothetical protein
MNHGANRRSIMTAKQMNDLTAEQRTLVVELAAAHDGRKTATGAVKGVYTRKIKTLETQLREQNLDPDDIVEAACQPQLQPEQREAPHPQADALGDSEIEALTAESASQRKADEAAANVLAKPEPQAVRPHIVDSQEVDGVRYSITDEGHVYAPAGDDRLGVIIGHVGRELVTEQIDDEIVVRETAYWVTERDDSRVARDRSRKQTLVSLVKAAA